jgi:hypothetical protein
MTQRVRHTKAETIARVRKEFEALERVLRRLSAADLARPVPGFGARARIRREVWTGKDALAHIVEWKRQVLRSLRREGADPELRGLDIAKQNRILYERWHRRPVRDVIAFHRSVHRDVMAALRKLPDRYFATPRSAQWPNDLTGHSAGHRIRHLESYVLERKRPLGSKRPASGAAARSAASRRGRGAAPV